MSITDLIRAYNQADYDLAHQKFSWGKHEYVSEQKSFILADIRSLGYDMEYDPIKQQWYAVKGDD